MPRFAANLTLLFQEFQLVERFAQAAEAGFDTVEILWPYDAPGQQIRSALLAHDLTLCLINAPPPNYGGGAAGFAAIPGGEARFRHDFKRVLRYAALLNPTHIHIMAGEGEGAHDTFVENLRWASAQAPGQSLTIEPINTGDRPGYYLNDYAYALEVLDAVDAPNLGLQFDAYHAQKITGNAMKAWDEFGHRAVHVQIAGAEGRHEPLRGAIDYPAFFERLDADGYAGVVSAEYHPATTTLAGLGWLL